MADRQSFLVAFLLAVFVAGCDAGSGAPERPRPHLVLLSIDTLNRSALTSFDPTARPLPNLDRMARVCTKFLDASSTASWTLPSHGSIFTGLLPHDHGAVHHDAVLHPDIPTLAERLGEAGYETVGFTDGGYLSGHFGFASGFDRYDEHTADESAAQMGLPRGGRPAEVHGDALFDRGRAYLAQRKSDDPLFLFLHTYAVHDYFQVHPWAAASVAGPTRSADEYLDCLVGNEACPAEDWERLRELYEAELRHLDDALPPLLQALDHHASGRPTGRPTYLFVLSDHGEGLAAGTGRQHHGGWLHPEIVRVPLLVCGPGLDGGVIDAPVSLADVFPSLLELAGVPVPDGLAGAALFEQKDAQRWLVAEEHQYVWPEGRRAVVRFDDRLPVRIAMMNRSSWWIATAEGELRRYGKTEPDSQASSRMDGEESERLSAAMRRLLQRAAIDSRGTVGPELERELRALGYVN